VAYREVARSMSAASRTRHRRFTPRRSRSPETVVPMDAVLGSEFKDRGASQVILDKLIDFLVPKPSLVLPLGYRIPPIDGCNPNLRKKFSQVRGPMRGLE